MAIIEEINKNELRESSRWSSQEGSSGEPTPTIINFESARNALGPAELEEAHSRAALAEYSRLQKSLSEDWLELLITMALLFAVLSALYIGFLG